MIFVTKSMICSNGRKSNRVGRNNNCSDTFPVFGVEAPFVLQPALEGFIY